MQITEINVKPIPALRQGNPSHPLLAVCSIVFDHVFVIHEVKIVGGKEPLIIDMPSRKSLDRCQCGTRNSTSSRYCNGCGTAITPKLPLDPDGKQVHRVNMAHPIENSFRQYLEREIRNKVGQVLSGINPPCPDNL